MQSFRPTISCVILAIASVLLAGAPRRVSAADADHPYGLTSLRASKPYLLMPERAGGSFPPLLSQTGAFKDTRTLAPADALLPYDLNIAFWSDGATKSRWISLPADAGGRTAKIGFAPTGEWTFPNGTVFVKLFELAIDETRPELKHRLETRLLVRDADGGVYGATYKWREDNSDAELLATNLSETISIKTASGTREQTWYYPSRQDCLTCHTTNAGLVLGVKTRQLNRDFTYPGSVTDNQLRAWNHAGLFASAFDESELPTFAKLAPANDLSRSLEDRARSYLDANCAHCHRPAGTVAYFDARYDTPLARQEIIGGRVLIDQRIDNSRVIAPNDIWRSILYMRVNTVEAVKMPQLAHNVLDARAVALLRDWIHSLPGPPVLDPPALSPHGGNFDKPVEVTITQSEPGAEIHYTLDGTVPTASDPRYEKPIQVSGPTIVRARAFKTGFTRSIAVQEIFLIGG